MSEHNLLRVFIAASIILMMYVTTVNEYASEHMDDKLQNQITELKEELSEYKKDNIETAVDDKLFKKTFWVTEEVMTVTAYCPCEDCCNQYADGLTSTGTSAYTKGVAVDPKFIKYGSGVFIPGYGEVVADDCGGAIKGGRLDVRFKTHQEALNWGVKILKVKIYRETK